MKPKRFENRVTICVQPNMESTLRPAADRTMTSVSDYARRAIVEKLQRDGFISAPQAA
jgi:hypothetical protein